MKTSSKYLIGGGSVLVLLTCMTLYVATRNWVPDLPVSVGAKPSSTHSVSTNTTVTTTKPDGTQTVTTTSTKMEPKVRKNKLTISAQRKLNDHDKTPRYEIYYERKVPLFDNNLWLGTGIGTEGQVRLGVGVEF